MAGFDPARFSNFRKAVLTQCQANVQGMPGSWSMAIGHAWDDKICVVVPCDAKVVDPYFRTLLFHGLESDWLEEECDDDVFRHQQIHRNSSSKINNVIMTCVVIQLRLMLRKDVLEQKVNQVLESVGYSSRGLVYTVLKPSLSSSFLLSFY